jgi:hypothetical protein
MGAERESLADPHGGPAATDRFFTNIGVQISEAVPPTKIKPEDYLTPSPNTPDLNFNAIGPNQIIDII